MRHYSLDSADLAIAKNHRGDANRLGFAVQLCYMRYPGIILALSDKPTPKIVQIVSDQLDINSDEWGKYGKRAETRREHLQELQRLFKYKSFSSSHQQAAVAELVPLALQTDKGISLAQSLIEGLRSKKILLPSIGAMEKICAQALTQADRQIFKVLHSSLSATNKDRLDRLLERRTQSTIT